MPARLPWEELVNRMHKHPGLCDHLDVWLGARHAYLLRPSDTPVAVMGTPIFTREELASALARADQLRSST